MKYYAYPEFIRNFGFYFICDRLVRSSPDEIEFGENERVFWEGYYGLTAKLKGNYDASEIHRIVQFIERSGYIHQEHFQGYMQLKTEFGMEETLNFFAALFEVSEYQILSWPAEKILYDHFAEIVLEVEKNIPRELSNSRECKLAFEDSVLDVLGKYVLKYCHKDDLTVWGEDYYVDVDSEPQPVEEGRPFEEYEKLNCYVHLTDADTLERVRAAQYIAAYQTTDLGNGVMLIGNLLTFACKDEFKNAVTLQIVGHQCFDTFEEMYHELGIEAFGYSEGSTECCVNEKPAFFERFREVGAGALALKVRQIDMPILTQNDFSKHQSYNPVNS